MWSWRGQEGSCVQREPAAVQQLRRKRTGSGPLGRQHQHQREQHLTSSPCSEPRRPASGAAAARERQLPPARASCSCQPPAHDSRRAGRPTSMPPGPPAAQPAQQQLLFRHGAAGGSRSGGPSGGGSSMISSGGGGGGAALLLPHAAAAPGRGRPRATVLSAAELAACGGLVLYFIAILFAEGDRFCRRLVAAGVAVPGLAPGLLGAGSRVDVSDHQWREFRGSLPLLAGLFAGFAAASHAVRAAAPRHRLAFYVAFSLVLLAVLHGAAAAYVLALALAGYGLARATAGLRHGLALVWAWHIATFLAVRASEGLPFAAWLGPGLGGALDAHRGLLRWHIHYNLLLLRMLSYAADYRWAAAKRPGRGRLPAGTPPTPDQDVRTRSELWQPAGAYGLATYLAYAFYPPLYIAGPILTFNAFASQLAAPSAAVTPAAVARYALRAAGCWAVMEALSHRLWFAAVVRHRLWAPLAAAEGVGHLAPLDMCLIPWWVMILFWLKFTVIWRFFRLAALADGLEAPENMGRCICNNYDLAGFWRNWHASYNQWLVRYMYVPLGGAAWRLANVWPIFTFVALWHDLEPRLLGWAWLMALLFAPELGVKWLGRQGWCLPDKAGRPFRYAAGAAAALNIVALIAANMVGFVLGLDGIRTFVEQVLGVPRFLPLVLLACFCGAQLMFALRDVEAARAGPGGGGAGAAAAAAAAASGGGAGVDDGRASADGHSKC